jgi:lipopolysaccharide export system protein LptA
VLLTERRLKCEKLAPYGVNALGPLRLKNIYSLSLLASLSLSPVIVSAQQSIETGLITIESDQQTSDNSIGVVTAQGNVRLVHVDRGIVATGRQAQYFMKEERIVLSGDVDIVQKNGDLLQADRIVYSLVDERALATPSENEQVFSQWSFGADPDDSTPVIP